ncbi:ZIP family metal transporter [Pararhodobacter marinus]|uniref:ZIP family metal transporter n=1 Tax=Pararhodobacter marinus TaxID=2184063 RepID=UPI0035135DF9
MLTTIVVLLIVAVALLIGAGWGLWAPLPKRLEGFLIALAGGALIVSIMSELVDRAAPHIPWLVLAASLMAGAGAFVLLDRFVKRKLGAESGGGLLVSVTLDGVPENLALGVALIGASGLEVAALAGSIFLSNLPEAAGGAKGMRDDGYSKAKVFGIWAGTAVLLSVAALIGNLALSDVGEAVLAVIRVFAAGVVAASLAIEVFPKASDEDRYATGFAIALGLVAAQGLGQLAG